jgi:hypothetical protein
MSKLRGGVYVSRRTVLYTVYLVFHPSVPASKKTRYFLQDGAKVGLGALALSFSLKSLINVERLECRISAQVQFVLLKYNIEIRDQ